MRFNAVDALEAFDGRKLKVEITLRFRKFMKLTLAQKITLVGCNYEEYNIPSSSRLQLIKQDN